MCVFGEFERSMTRERVMAGIQLGVGGWRIVMRTKWQ
jgi:hypothetical protein